MQCNYMVALAYILRNRLDNWRLIVQLLFLITNFPPKWESSYWAILIFEPLLGISNIVSMSPVIYYVCTEKAQLKQ
jgi:hypothetical protein